MKNLNQNKTILSQYSIRLPKELLDTLKLLASKNSQSLCKEIVTRLKQSLILDECPECRDYLKMVEKHKNMLEEQYKLFEKLNRNNDG